MSTVRSRARGRPRQLSAPARASCHSITSSLDQLDHSTKKIKTSTLPKLRTLVLSHLADIETRLSLLESPIAEVEESETPGLSADDANAWIREGLEMLKTIRMDVCSHLPELDFSIPDGVNSVRAHLSDVRAHLPHLDLPDVRARLRHLDLPEFPNVRSHLPHIDLSLDDVRARIGMPEFDFDMSFPNLDYLPTLSSRLQSLHAHLSSLQLPSTLPSFAPNKLLSELIETLLDDTDVKDEKPTQALRIPHQISTALKRSLDGRRLVNFMDLPEKWRNNEYVQTGYRFIPLERWHALFLSIFHLHNESLNIHTHLIPLLISLPLLSVPSFSLTVDDNLPFNLFSFFSTMCLATSVFWHVFAGCAHERMMEVAARVDYVGIGWLISASIATVVYHGFTCRPTALIAYLSLTLVLGIAGTILPFMHWFNERKNKKWRIVFFLALAFTGLAPLTHLSIAHSLWDMFSFFRHIIPSLLSYIIGLIFYATHFPECVLPANHFWLRWVGGASHPIWHCFIILAIRQHKHGMVFLKDGIGGEICSVWA